MTDQYQQFRAEVVSKLNGLTGEEWRERNPGQHLYARYGKYVSCAWCGRIKPRDRKPKPCPGLIQIGLRQPKAVGY